MIFVIVLIMSFIFFVVLCVDVVMGFGLEEDIDSVGDDEYNGDDV